MTKMKLLTTAEVAKRLGFSARTISRWCREGRFGDSAFKLGRVWRIEERRVMDIDVGP